MTSTSASRALPGDVGAVTPADPVRRAAVILSVVALVVMATTSVLGLWFPAGYGEPASTTAMLRGYDGVTLVFAVPALATALLGLWRGWTNVDPLRLGALAYAAYAYALSVSGAGFDEFYLLHVSALGITTFALLLTLFSVDVHAVTPGYPPRAGSRIASALLGLLTLGLGGTWVSGAVGHAVAGVMPAGSALAEAAAVVHTAIALGLALLVPASLTAAVLLWRGTHWGFILGAAALNVGGLCQLGYLIALTSLDSVLPGVPSHTWGWWLLGVYTAAAWALSSALDDRPGIVRRTSRAG